MESILDSTLLTIAVIITIATILALLRTQKRDRCLTHFDDYHATLSERDGAVIWGRIEVRTSGIEVHYPSAHRSKKGFWKQSSLFYKDQYERMEGIYRSTAGLTEEQNARRTQYLKRISNPGILWRFYRRLRNWVGMIRDALVQSVSLILGAAKSRSQPAAAVLARDEERMTSLSAEIIGHAGNAFDPLLEQHLFTRVIVVVSRKDITHQYCGYLADYTKDFLEIIDAQVNADEYHFEKKTFDVDKSTVEGLEVNVEDQVLEIENQTGKMLLFHELILGADEKPMPIGAVVPDGSKVLLRLDENVDEKSMKLLLSTATRVDMLVPRTHALVRHGVTGLKLSDIDSSIVETTDN